MSVASALAMFDTGTMRAFDVGVRLGVALVIASACSGGSMSSAATTTATEGSSGEASTSPTGTDGMSSTSAASSTSGASSTTAGETSSSSSTTGHVCPTPADYQCDLWAQDDCCEGEKCAPWANDSGGSWNADRCVPVVREPDKVGEPCSVLGGGASGLDTCEKGTMCWYVDAETWLGTCVAHCQGSDVQCSRDPTSCCAGGNWCTIYAGGWLTYCDYVCDPLGQDCPYAGTACYPVVDTFFCEYDVSWESGAVGDPCDFVNDCDPGNYCVDPSTFPGCDPNASGCCVPFCPLDAPACPPGTECLPFFDPNETPDGYENVGSCVIPP